MIVLREAPKVRCHIALRYVFWGGRFPPTSKAGVRRLPDSRFCKSLYKHLPCLPLPVRFIGQHGGVAFSELPADFRRRVSNQQLIVFGGIQDTQESFVDTICRYFMGILHWNRACTEIDPKLRTALYEAVVHTDVLHISIGIALPGKHRPQYDFVLMQSYDRQPVIPPEEGCDP